MKTKLIRVRDTVRAFPTGHRTTEAAQSRRSREVETPQATSSSGDWRERLGLAAKAVIEDPALPVATKRKRLLALLRVLDDGDGGSAPHGPEPTPGPSGDDVHATLLAA